MNTQKVAISIPSGLVVMIDAISRQRKVSRSKFISMILLDKLTQERNQHLKNAYNKIFSDKSIGEEQLETAKWFKGSKSEVGQEW